MHIGMFDEHLLCGAKLVSNGYTPFYVPRGAQQNDFWGEKEKARSKFVLKGLLKVPK